MHNPKFNEDLKQMSIYVYQDGNGKIPEGWKLIRTDSNDKTGYHAESYKKDKEIVIVYRGTDTQKGGGQFLKDFGIGDLPMGGNLPSGQLKDAENTLASISRENPSSRIVLTGHSLGGSLAQVVSAESGRKAVTFNAYGTGEVLENMGIKNQRLLDITNYGNPKDPIFSKSADNQPGTTYVTNTDLSPDYEAVFSKSRTQNYSFDNHKLENMSKLDKAVKVTQNDNNDNPSPMLIKAGVSYDINEKDTLTPKQQLSEKIKNKYNDIKNKYNQKLANKNSSNKSKSSASGSGHWVTINGAHIFLGD